MGLEFKFGRMGPVTKEIGKMTKQMDMEDSSMLMEMCMKETEKTTSFTDLERSKHSKEALM